MLIFVEGPDGSGKSTLVKALSDKYATAKVPRNAESIQLWNAIKRVSDGGDVVFDRSPITDLMYRILDGEACTCGIDNILYWLHGSKIIFCNSDTAFKDAMERGETNITDESRHNILSSIYETFMQILKLSKYDVMYYDWRYNSLTDVIEFIQGGKL